MTANRVLFLGSDAAQIYGTLWTFPASASGTGTSFDAFVLRYHLRMRTVRLGYRRRLLSVNRLQVHQGSPAPSNVASNKENVTFLPNVGVRYSLVKTPGRGTGNISHSVWACRSAEAFRCLCSVPLRYQCLAVARQGCERSFSGNPRALLLRASTGSPTRSILGQQTSPFFSAKAAGVIYQCPFGSVPRGSAPVLSDIHYPVPASGVSVDVIRFRYSSKSPPTGLLGLQFAFYVT